MVAGFRTEAQPHVKVQVIYFPPNTSSWVKQHRRPWLCRRGLVFRLCYCEIRVSQETKQAFLYPPLSFSRAFSSVPSPLSSALYFVFASLLSILPSFSSWFKQSLKKPWRLWSGSTYKQLLLHPCYRYFLPAFPSFNTSLFLLLFSFSPP